jgi:hypothetical protein
MGIGYIQILIVGSVSAISHKGFGLAVDWEGVTGYVEGLKA